MFDKLLEHIVSVVVSAVVLFAVAFFVVRTGMKDAVAVVRHEQATTAGPASGHKYTIMIADLEGTDGNSKADEISERLAQNAGISVYRYPKVLYVSLVGETASALAAADSEGRKWLDEKNADVLIWGHSTGNQLHLRFLRRSAPESQLQSFAIPDEIVLAADFKQALGDQIVALIVSAITPATEQEGQNYVEFLRPITARIDSLLKGGAPLTPQQRFTALHAYALASLLIGSQAGERNAIEAAIAALNSELTLVSPTEERRKWAIAQSTLGSALVFSGADKTSPDQLAAAVSALESAARAQALMADSIEWVRSLANLAGALELLGTRREGQLLLDSAIATSQMALRLIPRAQMRSLWPKVLMQLGSNLTALGTRNRNDSLLDQAIRIHTQVLDLLPRTTAPLLWATEQFKLGVSLAEFHRHNNPVSALRASAAAFQSALNIFSKQREPLMWGAAKWHLGTTYRSLGELEDSLPRLRLAVGTIEEALTVYSPSETPFYWAKVQGDLGGALLLVADRDRSDTLSLHRSLVAFRQALTVVTRGGAPFQWAWLQYNIGRQRLVAGEVAHNAQVLQEAVDALRLALGVYDEHGLNSQMEQLRTEIGQAEQIRDQARRAPLAHA